MNRIALGALLASVVFVLASFTDRAGSPGAAPEATAARRPSILREQDLTLDRVVRAHVAIPPYGNPIAVSLPPSLGFALKRIKLDDPNQNLSIVVTINGGTEERFATGTVGGGGLVPAQSLDIVLDPPLIVRPGDTFAIQQVGSATPREATLCGYTVTSSEI